MSGLRQFLSNHKLGATIATAALIVGGGVAVASAADDVATVTSIIDGDTIEIMIDGEEQSVRLLNINTPESDECLADDATGFLEWRIPPGTQVNLKYDKDRHDQYGRVLAGVVEGGSLVNAEIAKNGLGVAVLFEPNNRFYDDVLEAQHEAEEQGLGLWSEDIACTLVSQVNQYDQSVTDLEGRIGRGTLPEIDGWAAEAAVLAATGVALAKMLDGDRTVLPLLAFTGPSWSLQDDVATYNARVAEAETPIDRARETEEQRIEAKERREREAEERREREEQERKEREEAERIEREEQERIEREEAARQAAEEARLEREAAERREADRRAAERAEEQRRQSANSGGSASSGSSGGGGSVYYKNCSAARAAGAAPVLIGQPGYGTHLDRDRDGIGCE